MRYVLEIEEKFLVAHITGISQLMLMDDLSYNLCLCYRDSIFIIAFCVPEWGG